MVSARLLLDARPLPLGAALSVGAPLFLADGEALPLPLPSELDATAEAVSSALREGLRESEGEVLRDSEGAGDLLGRALREAVVVSLLRAEALLVPTTHAEGLGLTV